MWSKWFFVIACSHTCRCTVAHVFLVLASSNQANIPPHSHKESPVKSPLPTPKTPLYHIPPLTHPSSPSPNTSIMPQTPQNTYYVDHTEYPLQQLVSTWDVSTRPKTSPETTIPAPAVDDHEETRPDPPSYFGREPILPMPPPYATYGRQDRVTIPEHLRTEPSTTWPLPFAGASSHDHGVDPQPETPAARQHEQSAGQVLDLEGDSRGKLRRLEARLREVEQRLDILENGGDRKG